jgi:hypothetical protein
MIVDVLANRIDSDGEFDLKSAVRSFAATWWLSVDVLTGASQTCQVQL